MGETRKRFVNLLTKEEWLTNREVPASVTTF
jgi:hypothetical protein